VSHKAVIPRTRERYPGFVMTKRQRLFRLAWHKGNDTQYMAKDAVQDEAMIPRMCNTQGNLIGEWCWL